MKSFTRLLAQYRARVYESYFLKSDNATNLMNGLTTSSVSDYKPTVLVIEDNADQWFLTRWALLQRFAKIQIHWLSEADAVLPYLDSCQQLEMDLPKMILVDLYLPSAEQGLGVLHAIKSHPRYKPLPTLILSWSNRFEDITQVFNYSADGYVVKPTNYQDWIAELSLLDTYW